MTTVLPFAFLSEGEFMGLVGISVAPLDLSTVPKRSKWQDHLIVRAIIYKA
jgi:hypothetical protein